MNLTEHCEHTLQRYGVSGEDVHKWMDEPARIYGFQHRKVRHIADNPPKFAVDKYGFETAQNIIIDHILADGHNDPKKRRGLGKKQRRRKEELEQSITAMYVCFFDVWYEVRKLLDSRTLDYPYLVIRHKKMPGLLEEDILLKTMYDGRKDKTDDQSRENWEEILNRKKKTLDEYERTYRVKYEFDIY